MWWQKGSLGEHPPALAGWQPSSGHPGCPPVGSSSALVTQRRVRVNLAFLGSSEDSNFKATKRITYDQEHTALKKHYPEQPHASLCAELLSG